MAKNIVVSSDGSGQEGGPREEQRLSDVYGLYRVCRVGPDSGIDPREQTDACRPDERPGRRLSQAATRWRASSICSERLRPSISMSLALMARRAMRAGLTCPDAQRVTVDQEQGSSARSSSLPRPHSSALVTMAAKSSSASKRSICPIRTSSSLKRRSWISLSLSRNAACC
ncbi:hypothetical protein MOTC310_31765 [Methylobacterium oryzae]|uniref:Uncharacterized protein n=1 Tax=Methylobacterium oryzae TaxID=334852 RepID=A0ABU7TY05_9HYPH